jgi:hypothetical protein
MTVWGTFADKDKRPKIMLLDGWRKHFKLHFRVDGIRHPAENIVKHRNKLYRQRSLKFWGFVEYVADTCRRHQIDLLLIECKAFGLSAKNLDGPDNQGQSSITQ